MAEKYNNLNRSYPMSQNSSSHIKSFQIHKDCYVQGKKCNVSPVLN
jgi:hypothetical protein